MLADQDSNLDQQNQNLLCYPYTIGQCSRPESISRDATSTLCGPPRPWVHGPELVAVRAGKSP